MDVKNLFEQLAKKISKDKYNGYTQQEKAYLFNGFKMSY